MVVRKRLGDFARVVCVVEVFFLPERKAQESGLERFVCLKAEIFDRKEEVPSNTSVIKVVTLLRRFSRHGVCLCDLFLSCQHYTF